MEYTHVAGKSFFENYEDLEGGFLPFRKCCIYQVV